MAKTLWDINFSTLNVTNDAAYQGWDTKYTNTDNLTNGVYKADGQGSTPSFALNAIDIDWNGATLDSTVINTTGDLLKYIKAKSNLTLGTTSTTAAVGNHTHALTLQKTESATSSIDLLANTVYTLTAGGKTLTFKTQPGGTISGVQLVKVGSTSYTPSSDGVISLPAYPIGTVNKVKVGSTEYTPSSGLITLPAYPIGTVTKVKVGSTEYTPSSGVVSLPAYPTVPTYTAGTNITINSGTISHATPSGAASGNKGNKTTALLASITTDAQGHVTGYQTISVAELKELLGLTPTETIILNVSGPTNPIAYNGQSTLSASLTNGASASGTTWNITSGSSYATLSAATGASVTITGNNTATGGTTNNPGTITSSNPVSTSIAYNGNTTVSVSAGAGSVVVGGGTAQSVTVRATNTSATSGYQTKDFTITVNGKAGSSTSSAVSSYKWEFTAGSSYATLQNDTTATVKVVGNNSSSSDQTVTVRCKVTWANGQSAYSTAKSITVQKQSTPSTTYYWYVGTTVPTDPTNSAQNTGNNKWTSLGTNLPTSDIQVNKVDTSYNFSTWYIAAPSTANFTLYNGTNVASNEAAWNKSTFNVGSVQYTLWTSKGTSYQAVGYLHK